MLKELLSAKPESVPKGWLTTRQWAKKETGDENKVSTIAKYLQKGVALGIIEVKNFTVKCGSRVMPAPHYRIKESRNNS